MPLAAWMADYGIYDPLPEIAGTYAGKGLVVVGDAACVWDDLQRFGCAVSHRRGSVAKDGWDFLTINKAVETFPGDIEHAYSNEAELLHKFIAARRGEYRREFRGPVNVHTGSRGGAPIVWPWGGWGTSGLGACFVGLGLGYDRIVLAGMPLDDGPHNGEPPWRNCTFTREAAPPKDQARAPNGHWARAIDLGFDGRVTSLSGRTRMWMGDP